ncbi:hypothetical protein LJC57_04415 [Parabacteroides sp. OttesenSCG-928-G07]|nr:hypothetical protein [Parabacteroides sp. OttesenSCG-928-G21]MDL2277817.1 hypothetical protein [Parabacteroides sp. OttesenSCG-928-G07]
MMPNIPIIIVHKGDSFYLSPVLKQVRLFNPHSRIFLISDKSTNKYDFIEHCDISQYMENADKFEQVYKHMSVNPYKYELICFQRWFIIQDFAIEHKFSHFLCLDSDVLLFCNIDEVFNNYLNYDFTVCHRIGPGNSLFNSSSIGKLCDCMMSFYENKEILQKLEKYYREEIIEKNIRGGISDMTAFAWYQENISNNVLDLSIPKNNVCFDGAITVSSGFEMESGLKKIYWRNNLPYGKLIDNESFIQFLCLHFQGRSKYFIYRYLIDDQMNHRIGLWNTLKWFLSKKVLWTQIKAVRKILLSPQILLRKK